MTMEFINSFLNSQPKISGISSRRHVRPGLFLPFLLPSALILGVLTKNNYESNGIFIAYTFHSLLNACVLVIRGSGKSLFDLKKDFYVLSVIPAMIMIFVYVSVLSLGNSRSVCYIVANSLIYAEGIQFLFKAFPNTFTFGEANISIQGISLFFLSLVLNIDKIVTEGPPKNEYDISTCIIQLAVFCLIIYCSVPYVIISLRKTVPMYLWTFTLLASTYFLVLNLLKINLVLWIWEFCIVPHRINLLVLWSLCSAGAIFAVFFQIQSKKKSNTICRKIFHGLISIVFFSGIICDVNFIYLSSGGVFCLFLVLEVFRVMKIAPFGRFLQEGFLVFSDEKDSGGFSLTPISLLVGTSLPLWLFPLKSLAKKHIFLLSSGVMSVGIGDTFASIGGKLFGKHRWPGSMKTVEGTLFCIFSQIIVSLGLNYFGLITLNSYFLLPIFITSVVEALTDQIDNIVLPLVIKLAIKCEVAFKRLEDGNKIYTNKNGNKIKTMTKPYEDKNCFKM